MTINNIYHNTPNYEAFYKNKKVCLLGSGSSLLDHEIDYDKYDAVIGCNRIYKTEYYKHVNVHYHNLSLNDLVTVQVLNCINRFNKNIKKVLFCPWSGNWHEPNHNTKPLYALSRSLDITKFQKYDFAYNLSMVVSKFLSEGRAYTGLVALYHCVLFNPLSIDIYGFDFYERKKTYAKEMPYYEFDVHNKQTNKDLFQSIVDYNTNYNWFR
jgi:hypothetical protein